MAEGLARVIIRSQCCNADLTVTVGETFEQCTYACTKCKADKPTMIKKEVILQACPPEPLEEEEETTIPQIASQ